MSATHGHDGSTARAKQVGERRRQPTEIRRQLIVEAARAVIAERGLFATTMRDIALASDVSLGTVTYHFASLNDILAEVIQGEMEHFYRPIVARAAEAPDARTALQIVLDEFLASDERTVHHWLLWLDFWALSAHDEHYATRQSQAYAMWRADLGDILSRGLSDGSFTVTELDAAVVEFLALFDGLAAHAYLPGAKFTSAQARQRLYDYVNRVLLSPGDVPLAAAPDPHRRRR
jgi:AcrR family transcriptional regulator